MKKNTKLIFLILGLFILIPGVYRAYLAYASARTISWSPVTTYTDNTLIESGNTVTYNIWMQDNVTKTVTQLATNTPSTTQGFSDSALVKGRQYNFWGQAVLQSGVASDNSPQYSWALPLGKASQPTGWAVQ